MSIQHHLSESILIEYAGGTLDEGYSVIVATHLLACPECARKAKQAEMLGGALLEDLPPRAMSPDALSQALRRLDDAPQNKPEIKNAFAQTISGIVLPSTLQRYRIDRWRWLGPGIQRIRLLPGKNNSAKLELWRIAPGKAMPHHGHRGLELTCILAGAYSDKLGVFTPGDVAELDDVVEHTPIAASGAHCICLVALKQPLRMQGVIAKLLQPLLGL